MVILIIVAAAIITLFESGLLTTGTLYDGTPESNHTAFVVSCIMEAMTIIAIPLALKLFSLKSIKQQLQEKKEAALLKFGIIRMLMLLVPLVVNITLYYVFAESVAFGYMAIILAIALTFITPTKERCQAETNHE